MAIFVPCKSILYHANSIFFFAAFNVCLICFYLLSNFHKINLNYDINCIKNINDVIFSQFYKQLNMLYFKQIPKLNR